MMSSMVETAKKIATDAHAGQVYGVGNTNTPYIVHPTQAAAIAERLGYSEEVIAGCYLHDVLEDTEVTEAELRKHFPACVIDGVVAVTYMGVDQEAKIRQAMSDPIGHVIKFCDASCNFSNTVLYGAKRGKQDVEVIPRLAMYIAKLHQALPSPSEIEQYKNEHVSESY